MANWRFYQGLRNEWRWYRFNEAGNVIAQSDQGFAELPGCMANAEVAGFSGDAYQVHTRQAGEDTLVADEQERKIPGKTGGGSAWKGSPPSDSEPRKAASS